MLENENDILSLPKEIVELGRLISCIPNLESSGMNMSFSRFLQINMLY